MNTVTVQNVKNMLPDLVQNTIENCEETVIVSDAGAVVLIDQREWERIRETLRLLKDKTSLKALLDGHKARDTGLPVKTSTIEEEFYDLQAEHSEKCE